MNYAYIDAQNLHLGTRDDTWKVDLIKFRKYLKEKYNVKIAYYFIGTFDPKHNKMYRDIQSYGYILDFREHSKQMAGKKKGNVDVDIVFNIMEAIYKKENFKKIILVSGDGDYARLVKFLIKINKFEKLLAPNKKHISSLYKVLNTKYYSYLLNAKNKIEKK